MSAAALPYTLLLILAELAIGSLWVTVTSDLRGGVTRGFVMTMAFCIVIAAGLTYWTAATLDLTGNIGYPNRRRLVRPGEAGAAGGHG